MTMTKAIFFDIDGTLLSHTSGSVPESAVRALYALHDRGIRVAAATGRHLLELRELPVWDLPYDALVLLNGQMVLDGQLQPLFEAPFLPRERDYLVRLFREKKRPVILADRERMYINFSTSAVQRAQAAISTPVPEVGEYRGEKLFQAIVFAHEGAEEELSRVLPGCGLTRWNPYGLDITPQGGGKVMGIRLLLEKWGISREEIAAFGDGENDAEMLRFAGIGVAMGNAPESVKEAADYVTSSVDEDGVARGLQGLGIL